MKILNADQIREADDYTIKHEPVTSFALMERAAQLCADWLLNSSFLKEKGNSVHVFCGLGNNGGDGLAIARLLADKRYVVFVYLIRYSDRCSDDFRINEIRLKHLPSVNVLEIHTKSDLEKIQVSFPAVVIDAIFGSGFRNKALGLTAEVIDFINTLQLPVISIDVPSGLPPAVSSVEGNACIKAKHTLSFQTPKLAFMFPEYAEYIGNFTVLDIGLDLEFLKGLETINYFTTKADLKPFLKIRTKFSHKGSYGHALMLAGSYGKMGAALLASGACLRSGAGLLTVHVPGCGYEIMQSGLPEAMVSDEQEQRVISGLPSIEKYSAIGVGPGLGLDKRTQGVIKILIQNAALPLVLDADALNILSENKTWLSFLPKDSILTPHPKEFERLAGKSGSDYDRYCRLRDFAFKFSVYVVLKGAHTSIACPDGLVYFNSTGNPGMAKGGSGDVLTGILTGLMAQGYTARESAILGVYWHGLSGDIASEIHSQQSMTAKDIIGCMGKAFNLISS